MRARRSRGAGGLRIVQVGVGLWGQSWAELVHRAPGFRLAAVVDSGKEARGWAEQTLGVPTAARLDQAPEADAVLLVSPPSTHRPLAEQALAAGLHVLSEKPLAPTLADARAIAAAARRHGRVAMAGQNYRFRRQSRELQRLVRGNVLGPLQGIRIDFRRDMRNRWISRRDWRGQMAHPLITDMAIHHLDMVRMITGREIAEVDARGWRVGDSPFRHEPTVDALLTLDDDTTVVYHGTWAESLGRETSWNGDWELVGTKARATWTGAVNNALRGTVALEPFGKPRQRLRPPALTALDRLGVLHELRAAVEEGREPECSAEDNLRTLAAVFALAESTERRRPVRIAT